MIMLKKSRTCIKCGRAFAGSQKNIQIYVNYKTDELNKAIWEVISGNEKISWKPDGIKWVSPKEGEKEKFKEYRDEAFLEKLELARLKGNLEEFWPKRGPVWDALAVIGNGEGIILLEAKSHIEELKSDCKAGNKKSIDMINNSLSRIKGLLRVKEGEWKRGYYQSANRIAHLCFLRDNNIEAWLVNVYFCSDPHFIKDSLKSKQEWAPYIKAVKTHLGITGVGIKYTAEVFLEAIK